MVNEVPFSTASDGMCVADFYKAKSVLVTGGTGYLGKGLIEKLLYSCVGIENIYVLIREKEEESADQRLKKIIDSSAFDRVKKQDINVLNKIVTVPGNISEKNLGLTTEHLKIIQEKVSVVFHVAATVKFNEELSKAMAVNVNGTLEIISLCRRINKLEALIQVSTAFSNSDRKHFEEIVYCNNVDFEGLKSLTDFWSGDENDVKRLLGKKPNTYTYTKALAEEYVMKNGKDLPIAIIRPSIIISAMKEPSQGWIDSWNGSTGTFGGISSGVMKVMFGSGSNVADLVPLDIVVNLIIVAATKCKRSSLKVYNCCTGTSNPITCSRAEVIIRKATYKYSLNQLPFPFMVFTNSRLVYTLLRFILQIVPAFLIDLWSLFNGKKAIQMKIQHRITRTLDLMKFFMINEWHFEDSNTRELFENMSEEDKNVFNFDLKSIDWNSCIENYVVGIHKYLLKKSNISIKI